jgi:hypothetical protein
MRFQIADYIRLLRTFRTRGHVLRTVADFFEQPGPHDVILRHDVDRRPGRAVQLAEQEARADIRATYYLRCDRRGRFPDVAGRRIAAFGHEIGYHYEDLSRSGGDRVAALAAFAAHLKALRRLAPCRTISMHGSPLSRHDNRALLEGVDLSLHGLIGDASTGLAAFDPVYFTDAGGAWNDPRTNFRDRLGRMPENVNPLIPAELDRALEHHKGYPLCLNLHPERWSANWGQGLSATGFDGVARCLKWGIRRLRQ